MSNLPTARTTWHPRLPLKERKDGTPTADTTHLHTSSHLIIFAKLQKQISRFHGSSKNNSHCLKNNIIFWMIMRCDKVHLRKLPEKLSESPKHPRDSDSTSWDLGVKIDQQGNSCIKSQVIVIIVSSSIIIVLLKETRPLGTLNDPGGLVPSQTQSYAWLLHPT